ncbi:YciI family protein [Solicola sp. PLA-1-18]|uniref:YciI family protein n=1 Tax=Solicola sp. PLA-1-18 TaxID=3380532 RepID=UPI003B7A4B1C
MNHYLVSFPSSAMDVPPDELPAVSTASRAVIQDAKDAGVYVFGGGLDEDVPPVVVAGDGTVTDGAYPETEDLSGGFAVLKVSTRDEALRWAAALAEACRCGQEVREFMFDPES